MFPSKLPLDTTPSFRPYSAPTPNLTLCHDSSTPLWYNSPFFIVICELGDAGVFFLSFFLLFLSVRKLCVRWLVFFAPVIGSCVHFFLVFSFLSFTCDANRFWTRISTEVSILQRFCVFLNFEWPSGHIWIIRKIFNFEKRNRCQPQSVSQSQSRPAHVGEYRSITFALCLFALDDKQLLASFYVGMCV